MRLHYFTGSLKKYIAGGPPQDIQIDIDLSGEAHRKPPLHPWGCSSSRFIREEKLIKNYK
jgi:hypothetical protein